MFAVIGKKIVSKLNATAAFTSANGNNRVFPVIVPQGDNPFPCTTYVFSQISSLRYASKWGVVERRGYASTALSTIDTRARGPEH